MESFEGISKVYIIESPDSDDLFVNRSEGKALSKILPMSGINFDYKLAIDRDMFERAINNIIEEQKKSLNEHHNIFPYMHISAHGEKDGFYLTDNEFITWAQFKEYLNSILKCHEDFLFEYKDSGIKYSPLCLTMSVCEGINALKMCEIEGISPYSILVGPSEPISYSDALIAYSTFYHLYISKDNIFSGIDCVDRMNKAAGLDSIFKFNFGNEFHDVLDLHVKGKSC